MPCNCSGIRMRKCSCRVFSYPQKPRSSDNVVLAASSDSTWLSSAHSSTGKREFFYRLIEKVYDKCAGYNLRHCPLRGRHTREQHLISVARHVMILLCFLIANSVVFLTITIKMMTCICLFLRETVSWVKKSALKPDCSQSIQFQPLQYEYETHCTTSSL